MYFVEKEEIIKKLPMLENYQCWKRSVSIILLQQYYRIIMFIKDITRVNVTILVILSTQT